jgi:hypothetical protein
MYGWPDGRVEWMRFLYMIVVYWLCVRLYICMIMCIYVIFQFKTGVKLKWGCVNPMEHNNFLRLQNYSRK